MVLPTKGTNPLGCGHCAEQQLPLHCWVSTTNKHEQSVDMLGGIIPLDFRRAVTSKKEKSKTPDIHYLVKLPGLKLFQTRNGKSKTKMLTWGYSHNPDRRDCSETQTMEQLMVC